MAGYIRREKEGMVAYIFYIVWVCAAQDLAQTLPEVSGRYLHISMREICLWSKEPKPAWAAHEKARTR